MKNKQKEEEIIAEDTGGEGGERSVMGSQTFTNSGTWLCPPGVTSVTVECWGGGGKGGSVSGNTTEAGGGGGGGGYSKKVDIPVVPGTTYTVTVGLGSSTTAPGGDSWFLDPTTVLARGGNSVGDNSINGATGAAVGIGTPPFIYIGGNGADAVVGTYGGGGGSSAGTGSNGTHTYNGTGAPAPSGGGNGGNGRSGGNGPGAVGNYPGGGGGGARKGNGNGTFAGGAGGNGKVVITYCATPMAYNVTGGGSYCTGGSGIPIGLSNSQTGITYQLYLNTTTALGPAIPGNTGNPISFGAQTAAGTYTVIATNPDGNCTQLMTGSAIISINPLPTATISGTNTVCQNTASPLITFTGSNGTAPYTFTYNINGGANQVTPAGNPVTIAVPTNTVGNFTYYLVSVHDANGCSQNVNGQATITVSPGTPSQPGSITGNSTPCPNTNQTYSISPVPNATTYTWTLPIGWSLVSGVGTTTINVTSGTAGSTGNITVTAGNSCGTSAASILAVTVAPGTPAQPGLISGLTTQCPNTTGQIYSITPVVNATEYMWTVPNGWTITSGGTTNSITVTTGATGQNGSITVRAMNPCGLSSQRILAVNVGPGIPATPGAITGNSTPCPNIPNLVYSIAPVTNATTYNWNVPTGWTITSGNGTTSITVTSGATGDNEDIIVTAGNTCGNSAAATLAVTVLPGTPAVPGPISGTNLQCGNMTGQVYSIDPVPGASSYNWTAPIGWIITAGNGTNAITVTTGAPGQNGNIAVTATNSCGTSAAQTLAVTVNPGTPGLPGPISGPMNICFQQNGLVYSIDPVINATDYTWSAPTGWTITSGDGTTSITVNSGVPGQNGNISVTAGNVCGNSSASMLAVTVLTVPPQTSAITPSPATVCEASTHTFSVSPAPPAGTIYTWTVPGDWTINAGQGTEQITVVVGTQNGNITVTPSNVCGNGTPISHSVTVSLLPLSAGPIKGDDNYCEGTIHTYSVDAVAGLNYLWTVPDDWTIVSGQNTNSITIIAGATSGPVQVNPVNACGLGPVSTFNVMVNPLPAAYTGPDGGLCEGGQTEIGGPPVTGNTYSWTSDPIGFTSNISNPVVQPFETTTYYLTETTPAGCSKTNEMTIITNEVIILSVDPASQTICPGSNFTINITSNILGTQYTWDRDNTFTLTGTQTSGTGNPITGILNSTDPTTSQTTVFTIKGSAIGCADKITASVTVIDNTPPVITCPSDQTKEMVHGMCSYTAIGTEFDPTVTDNCTVTLTNSFNGSETLDGAVFPKGVTTVTWKATDPSGFESECKFKIEVKDNIKPEISCPGDQVVNVNNGCRYQHSGTGWDATATDNCSIEAVTYTLSGATTGTGSSLNNAFFNTGITTVTWRADDGTNLETCTYTVTVIDNIPPSITCPSNKTASANGACFANLNIEHPVITENCTINKLTWSITGATTGNSAAFGINYIPDNTAFNIGVSTVTYVVTDQSGLTATCSFTVTVIDNQLPVITCPVPAAFYPNTLDQCYATLIFAATATDNCGIQYIKYYIGGVGGTEITFPYNFPIGTTQVTAVATDIYNNSSLPCTFNVMVRDTQFPVISCVPSPQSRTANTGACNYTAVGNEFDPLMFSDNCPGVTITNDYNHNSSLAGAVFQPGNKNVTWTAQDAAGNKTMCSVVINVTDNEDPQLINCPTDITVYTGSNRLTCDQVATWTPPTAADNCSGTVTITSNYSPGATFPVGNTTVIYTATDASGNSTTCSFIVTVIDNTMPTFTVPANVTIYVTNSCTYNASVSATGDVTNEFDNCTPSGLQATFSDNIVNGLCPGTFVITRTWTLVDNHGNTNTQVQNITVADNIAPTLNAPPEITVQCHQGVDPTVTGQPTAFDNCASPVTVDFTDVVTAGNCPNASEINRTWIATDCSGNVTTKTQIIHVRDNTKPVIINVIDFTVDCPDDIPAIDIAHVSAVDNCDDNLKITFHHETAQFPPDVPGYCPRHITRYFYVEDDCGNLTIAEQEIIITDICDCSACNDDAPYFVIDFEGQPNGDTTIFNVVRDGLCCHSEEPNECVSFNVYLDEGSVGLQITVGGAVPGPHEWKVDCEDVEINNGIICLPGGTFYLFTYCKPGSNKNDYRFIALADIVVAGEFQSRVSCNQQIEVSSNVSNVTWNSIFPGTPGLYNSYLSCLDCLNPFFNPGPGAPPVIKYQVCGTVAGSPCVGELGYGCDTVTMYVHEPIHVTFNVDPGQFCLEAIPQIIATVTPEETTYILEWFAGSDTTVTPLWTGNGFTPPGPGPYTLKVTDTEEGVPCSIYLYPFIVAPDDDPPAIVPPLPLTLECNDSGNYQAIQNWLSMATVTDEHPLLYFEHDYEGITEGCNITLTVTWKAEDDCNNIGYATSTITIIDTQAPTWTTTPGSLDQTVECSDANALATAQALKPIPYDQCDDNLTVTKTSGLFITGSCPQAGTYTNTWVATDDCNNVSAVFTQVITVIDNTAPVWTTLPGTMNVSLDCSDLEGIAAAQTERPAALDNCSPTLTINKVAGAFIPDPGCSSAGTYTNTFTAVDNCNNVSSVYTQVITITDNNVPEITQEAQNATVECDGSGNLTELNNWLNNHGSATATDACNGVLTWTYETPVFQAQCGETGYYTVLFTVKDECDNSATTTGIFTIVDTEDPIISCPQNVTANVDLTNCVATGVNLDTPVVSDDCSNVTITNDAPSAFPPGVTIVTWTATDACGNFSTCQQTVTVEDLLPPSVECPADPAPVNAAPGTCSAFVTVPPPNVTDPCPVNITNNSPYQTSLTNASGTYPVGTTVVTWTITGISGVSTSCTQNVTVVDNQLPTITCPQNVTALAPPPACSLEVITILPPTINDNCDPTDLTLSWEKTGATSGIGTGNINGTVFNVGVTTVTYTVTDPYNNNASCSFTVTVNDEVPPTVITCPGNQVVNNNPGECYADVIVHLPEVEDLCGEIVSYSNDFNGGTNASGQYPVGITVVTWTFLDDSGNDATCQHTITVNDTEDPQITCPPDAIDMITDGGCDLVPGSLGLPTIIDNCPIDPAAQLSWVLTGATTGSGFGYVNGQSFNVGVTTVTYTVTDRGNYTATCPFTVWIKNSEAPQFEADCPVSPVNANAGENCNTYVIVPSPDIANPCMEFYTSINNSPYRTSDTDASGYYPVGTTTFEWTVTDASGNVTTCVQSLVVTDVTPPSITCPASIEDFITNGGCTLVPGNIGLPTISDNCSLSVETNLAWEMTGATTGTGYGYVNGQTFNVGQTFVEYTVTDGAGLTASCTFTVWVKNLEAPQFEATCPQANIIVDASANCSTFVSVPTPDISNPCNESYTVFNNSPFKTSDADASGTYPAGTTSFTWTITDASGNIKTCPQSVTVVDHTDPVINCPGYIEQELINGDCELADVVIPNPTFSDNCGVVTLLWETEGATILSSPTTGIYYFTGYTLNVGVTTVKYTAIDANGNFATCSFDVWIKDLSPQFNAECPANVTAPSDANRCGAHVIVPKPDIYNPCDEYYTVENDSDYADDDASGFYPVGTTEVHWIITDASGNVKNCTQLVIVTDLPPVLVCPPSQVVQAEYEKPYAIGVVLGDPTYSDNCGIASLTWIQSPPTPGSSPLTGINIDTTSIFYAGVTTITYTAVDNHGDTTRCSFTITVLSEPIIECQPDTSLTTDPGLCSANLNPGYPELLSGVEPITWTWTITNQSGDVIGSGTCTTATLPTCLGSFTFPVGTNTITWTAENISGIDQCTQTVTVVDDEPPTITTPAPPSFCVINIFSAVYDGQPEPAADIIPDPLFAPPYPSNWRRPDWYVFDGTTELDVIIADNCCVNENTISWTIDFAGTDPNQPSIVGTGQPSDFGPIILWGTPLNQDITHTITYTVTDCAGNASIPIIMDILIKPRPDVIKP